jgi:hypothetical protein
MDAFFASVYQRVVPLSFEDPGKKWSASVAASGVSSRH